MGLEAALDAYPHYHLKMDPENFEGWFIKENFDVVFRLFLNQFARPAGFIFPLAWPQNILSLSLA